MAIEPRDPTSIRELRVFFSATTLGAPTSARPATIEPPIRSDFDLSGPAQSDTDPDGLGRFVSHQVPMARRDTVNGTPVRMGSMVQTTTMVPTSRTLPRIW